MCKRLVDSVLCRTIKFLVLDEADKLLSMDFQVAIDKLLEVPCYTHPHAQQCISTTVDRNTVFN